MLFADVIRHKRDGGVLGDAEIQFFVDGLADGSLPAEQVSSLAMAIFLNSMTFDETATLTTAMAESGTVLDWSSAGLDGPVVDKHSTGGVGDKVSFLLAPIAAACGCFVPMISGRGLGHTGGTTDKAESIPGYNTAPDFETFRKVVKTIGCAVIGQTSDLAPADRRLYSIRDVTATVESIPLITASILSKKIAAGLNALVMDVKVGSGAFMPTYERSVDLAKSIIATAAKAGLKTSAVLTDMNEVLGTTAGNALEIEEAMAFLRNDYRESRLDEVVLALCAEMLLTAGLEDDVDTAAKRCDDAVSSGRAAEIFDRMCASLGGPGDFVDNSRKYLATAPVQKPVFGKGYLTAVDVRAVGNSIIELGGGRRQVGETLDLSVGLSDVAPIGTYLDAQRPLAVIHAASPDAAAHVEKLLLEACSTSDSAPSESVVIHQKLSGPG
ncbi:MAG: thymidine phosphorylase [Gammaproteobacteria bacterium]|nr:thymidine phosphorylase [Gammaproteobacteria bacterium]MDH3432233.1 thymidine phosphorylase [Gammaproteobacteria bacterium]